MLKIKHSRLYMALIMMLGLSLPATAHHSHGNYEIGKKIEVTGTVTELLIANPHVWVFMNSDASGETEAWSLESGSKNGFVRRGWDKIKVGDNISVTCAPTRDKTNSCFIGDIVINSSDETAIADEKWVSFAGEDQHFSVNFPAKPTISTAPFKAEYGGTFPSKIYSVTSGDNLYSITVVDYSDAKNIYLKLADEINVAGASNFWLYDQMGAIAYAAQQFRLRGGEVTYDAWHHVDFIDGHQVYITNPDTTRTYAGIYRHADRLFILEATVTADTPPQGIFQQSLTVLDDDGKRIRYDLLPDHTRTRVDAD